MHIAIFIHNLATSGAQRRTVTLANAFADHGHKVDLVVVRGAQDEPCGLSTKVRLVALNASGSAKATGRLGRAADVGMHIPALTRYLDGHGPDVLLSAANHVHNAALIARRLSRTKPPTVIRASNNVSKSCWNEICLPKPFKWLVSRLVMRWTDAVIAVSKGVADDIANQGQIRPERIQTIYNPTVTPDIMELADAPVAHPWLEEKTEPVILAAGRLVPQKHYSCLIEAFAKLRQKRPCRLIIIGEGSERPKLSALAQRLGVAEHIDMPGHVENPFAWMSKASAFVVSSIWEGLPGVLIEAMACGCPVVSTDCESGPREILDNGSLGPLVPVGDAPALADAIADVLDSPLDSAVLTRKAAAYDFDTAIESYLSVLTGAAQGSVAAIPKIAEHRV